MSKQVRDFFKFCNLLKKYPNFTPPVNTKESPGNRTQPNILKTKGMSTGTNTHIVGTLMKLKC